MIATHNHSHDLEDHIPMLRKLDEARQYSASQRDEGIGVLLECLDLLDTSNSTPDSGDWRIEISLAVRALLTRHNQPMKKDEDEEKRKKLIGQLIGKLRNELTLDELDKNELSVLVAANSLRSMTGQPGAVFSKEAMYCYYWIIRELYSADRGDWNIGGARAAPKSLSPVTAFTTGECVRALLMLAETMKNAGEFVAAIADYLERKEHLSSVESVFSNNFSDYKLAKWVELEKKRASLSCSLKLKKYSRYIALSDELITQGEHSQITIDTFTETLNKFINSTEADLTTALQEIENYRTREKTITDSSGTSTTTDQALGTCSSQNYSNWNSSTKEKINNVTRSESAHWIAILAVTQSLERAQRALNNIDGSSEPDNLKRIRKISQLRNMFDDAARDIHKLLHPVRNYLSSIIDRELTLVSLGKSWDWQPAELACAASCYGRLTNEWKTDKRFNQVVSDLSQMISSRGRLANPTKYHERSDGVSHIVVNAAILHSMAQLLRSTQEGDIDPELAEKMLRFFVDTRATKPRQTWLFSAEDIKNSFIKKLYNSSPAAPFTAIKTSLDNSLSSIQFPPKSNMPEAISKALAEDLAKNFNKLLQDNKNYDLFINLCDQISVPDLKENIKQKLKEATEENETSHWRRRCLEIVFEGDLVASTPRSVCNKKGWAWEFLTPPLRTGLRATASAVMALAEINEMLDARINHIILEHFSVKKINKGLDGGLVLDNLFYPDYGLQAAPAASKSDEADFNALKKSAKKFIDNGKIPDDEKDKSKKSIDEFAGGIKREANDLTAFTMQRICAHVSRLQLPTKSRLQLPTEYDSVFSLILHGPAGTGKTTFVESLAATCGVPLVEVTPSDLVKRGQDNIEERARAVFEALSLLTRVVILFDEFDPVLKRRGTGDKNQLNVFSFLTPGMLPKLKDLYSKAKKRSVAYVLITNLIGDLDEAAIRQGRFDSRLGIYPPDRLSRTGRFLDIVHKYNEELQSNSRKDLTSSDHIEKIKTIIKSTEGKGMVALTQKEWFNSPGNKIQKTGSPFYSIWHNGTVDILEPDDELKSIRGEGNVAVKEFLQWFWINQQELEK